MPYTESDVEFNTQQRSERIRRNRRIVEQQIRDLSHYDLKPLQEFLGVTSPLVFNNMEGTDKDPEGEDIHIWSNQSLIFTAQAKRRTSQHRTSDGSPLAVDLLVEFIRMYRLRRPTARTLIVCDAGRDLYRIPYQQPIIPVFDEANNIWVAERDFATTAVQHDLTVLYVVGSTDCFWFRSNAVRKIVEPIRQIWMRRFARFEPLVMNNVFKGQQRWDFTDDMRCDTTIKAKPELARDEEGRPDMKYVKLGDDEPVLCNIAKAMAMLSFSGAKPSLHEGVDFVRCQRR